LKKVEAMVIEAIEFEDSKLIWITDLEVVSARVEGFTGKDK
jgi:hypothetical protein